MNAFSVRQVFDWNYETEFAALLESVDVAGSLVAFDIKFPGLMCDTPWCVSREEQYEVIHGNVNFLQPSQIGLTVACADGSIIGTWSFNIQRTDLCGPGIEAQREQVQEEKGISMKTLEASVGDSHLVESSSQICWVSLTGMYGFGYLVKLLSGSSLPSDIEDFDAVVAVHCPFHYQLTNFMEDISLAALAWRLDLQPQAGDAGANSLVILYAFLCFASETKVDEAEQSDAEAGKEWDAKFPGSRLSEKSTEYPDVLLMKLAGG